MRFLGLGVLLWLFGCRPEALEHVAVEVSAEPSPLGFDEVPVGVTAFRRLKVTNLSRAKLTLEIEAERPFAVSAATLAVDG